LNRGTFEQTNNWTNDNFVPIGALIAKEVVIGGLFVVSPKPRREDWSVLANFILGEIQSDLASRGFWAIGSVDQIHLPAAAEIAPDGSCGGFQAVGRSEHISNDPNDFKPFNYQRDDWSAGDECLQTWVEWFFDVLSIVLLGKFRRDLDQLHRNNVDGFFLKSRNDRANHSSLNTIWLKQNK
jgi:hypothetical protein